MLKNPTATSTPDIGVCITPLSQTTGVAHAPLVGSRTRSLPPAAVAASATAAAGHRHRAPLRCSRRRGGLRRARKEAAAAASSSARRRRRRLFSMSIAVATTVAIAAMRRLRRRRLGGRAAAVVTRPRVRGTIACASESENIHRSRGETQRHSKAPQNIESATCVRISRWYL